MAKLNKKTRIESDTLGPIAVSTHRYWGAQTQRSIKNFKIGQWKFPREFIRAYAIVKYAGAKANSELKLIDRSKAKLIMAAAKEVMDGRWDDHFPVVIFQTGSGTQFNMNMNEVIANRAIQLAGGSLGSKSPIHPNDDVNRSQSSNDTFPTAMHIATMSALEEKLFPNAEGLRKILEKKAHSFSKIIKLGRTHLQDAVPLTLGDEISAWEVQIKKALKRLRNELSELSELALGGSAVGTGLNTHPLFSQKAIQEINKLTGYSFRPTSNRFEALASHDTLAATSAGLRTLAGALFKIADDIRWMASGPRGGLNEISIPNNEPGSSIMPSKANPTQAEALQMVVAQVYGNDTAIAFSASQGNFELNTFKPVIIFNLLNSIELLGDSCQSFSKNCAAGMKPNREQIKKTVDSSLMLATALSPHIGYENAAKTVKKAETEGLTLKEAAKKLGLATEADLNRWINLKKMVGLTR